MPSSSSAIQLVCFDLGRVLIRICDDWRQACEVVGLPAPGAELTPAAKASLLRSVGRIEVGEGGQAGIDAFCRDAAGHLGIPPDHVARVWQGWTRGPYPGAPELVADLAAAGVKTACLSNTNVQHWSILTDPADPHYAALGPLNWRFASHLIGARKPDAAAYAHVEHRTGIPPSAILFFDDVPENIEAANRRGWRGRIVDRCDNPVPIIHSVLRHEGVL